jgi:diphthamide biosynthesis protein 7
MVTTLFKFETRIPPDCVQWCPSAWNHETWILATGTYHYNEKNQALAKREGSIYLHTLRHENKQWKCQESFEREVNVRVGHENQASGVLHMEWTTFNMNCLPFLVVSNSIGSIQLYQLEEGIKETNKKFSANEFEETEYSPGLKLIETYFLSTYPSLCLYINVSRHLPYHCVTSDHQGYVHILNMEIPKNRNTSTSYSWKAHEGEVWTCSWHFQRVYELFSTGDDGSFQLWDVRASTHKSQWKSVWHKAGVTSLEQHPSKPFIFLTGSYDEHLCLWDERYLKEPLYNTHISNAGIWRIRWHPQSSSLVALACMYEGFRLFSLEMNEEKQKISMKEDINYREHQSIAYGIDWLPSSTSSHSILASCSFYDRKVHIWES